MAADETLVQRTLTVPDLQQHAVTFTSVADAVRHLLDHLLTAPECVAWASVLTEWAPLLDDTTATPPLPERTSFRQRLTQTTGAAGQPLFDRWIAELDRQARSAASLGWWTLTTDRGRQGLGIHAARLIYASSAAGWCLTTAYLIGQGDPAEVAAARAEQRLRHERDPGRSRRGRRNPLSRREQREADWSADERFYYRCFRPALRELRRTAISTAALSAQLRENREQDRQALWQVVSRTQPASCEEWCRLRDQHYPPLETEQEQEAS